MGAHAAEDCHKAYSALLAVSGPSAILCPQLEPNTSLDWEIQKLGRFPGELNDLNWVLQRAPMQMAMHDWKQISTDTTLPPSRDQICSICQPKLPIITDPKSGARSEKAQEAARYERSIKLQPPSYILLSRVIDEQAELRFSVNIRTMAHHACGRLVGLVHASDVPKVDISWRLVTNTLDLAKRSLRAFTLSSNTEDTAAENPPGFEKGVTLDEEQRRSLGWMIAQESEEIDPFTEEEVDEAILPAMAC
ncbi:hypothetical protein N7532_003683 [Penicillium argentinense]|uniref:Uncharacterized protein n=1 Tax=Penicillium argentinense TaxID=1131581 RepID=A0A9W9KE83_9EURO|nr:uncharacterized protein N7532_003683 [Penicillium argentinense]KAJ5103154.1 hypothetical protein N7532_003683 [Penicillium argentinense]